MKSIAVKLGNEYPQLQRCSNHKRIMVTTARRANVSVAVLVGGLITSAIARALVWWISHTAPDWNPMNFNAAFILPIRPILVGLPAGSGCAFMTK